MLWCGDVGVAMLVWRCCGVTMLWCGDVGVTMVLCDDVGGVTMTRTGGVRGV